MSTETEFVNGLNFKAPNENAPEYVKSKGWIKNAEMIAFLQARIAKGEESTNFDVKVGQSGKWYAAVDNWKPNTGTSTSGARGGAPQRERPASATAAPADEFASDDIPFLSQRGAF